jgi:hypothetical protein
VLLRTIMILLAAGTIGMITLKVWKTRWTHIADWSFVTAALGIVGTILYLLLCARGETSRTVHETFASVFVITLSSIWLYKYAEKKESGE